MSGGAYDYIYLRIEAFADDLNCDTFERRLFQDLLYRVAKAARDIEWNDSGDGAKDEFASIRACFEDDCEDVAIGYLKDLYNYIGNYLEVGKE